MSFGAPDDVEAFRRLVLGRWGLILSAGKDYLLKSRLEPISRAEGLADVATMVRQVRIAPAARLSELRHLAVPGQRRDGRGSGGGVRADAGAGGCVPGQGGPSGRQPERHTRTAP